MPRGAGRREAEGIPRLWFRRWRLRQTLAQPYGLLFDFRGERSGPRRGGGWRAIANRPEFLFRRIPATANQATSNAPPLTIAAARVKVMTCLAGAQW